MKANNVPNTAPMIFIKVEKLGTRHTINPLNVTKINRINMGSIFSVDCEFWFAVVGLKPIHFL